jgi:hypothetical protein
MMEKICGTCQWNRNVFDEWVCCCYKSDQCMEWTEYKSTCPEWHGIEEEADD